MEDEWKGKMKVQEQGRKEDEWNWERKMEDD